MVWVKLDDRFPEHPKVAALDAESFRSHVEALCYCGRNSTDGFIPTRMAGPNAEKLVKARLWEPRDGGYLIHGFLEYNPSAEEVKSKREQAAERMRRVRANFPRTSREPVSTPHPPPYPIEQPPLSPPGGGAGSKNGRRPRRRYLRGDE